MQRFSAFGRIPTIPNDSLPLNIEKAPNFQSKFNATQDLIRFHKRVGNIDSIILYASRLYDETKLLSPKNNRYLATTSQQIADAKLKKGLFDDALEWYLTGIKYSENIKNKESLYNNKIGLGVTKYARNTKEEGISIIEECLKNAPSQKIKYDAMFALGKLMTLENRYKESKEYLDQSLSYYQEEGYYKEELYTILNLGILSSKLDENEEAINLFFDIFNKALNNQYYDLYIIAGSNIGRLYAKRQDYENAKIILTTVYTNAIQWENLEAQKNVLDLLRRVHAETGDFQNAYALMTQLKNIEKTVLNNQNKAEVNENK